MDAYQSPAIAARPLVPRSSFLLYDDNNSGPSLQTFLCVDAERELEGAQLLPRHAHAPLLRPQLLAWPQIAL